LQPGIGQSAIQTTPPVVQDRFRTPPEPLPMDGLAPSNLGGDRFADFYNAFRIADQAGVNQLGFESQRLQPADPMRPGHVLARRTDAGLNQIDTSAKWAKDVFEDPVTTFVGKYANDLNRYLAAGEEAMKRGEYYKAARLFDLARAVDPVNPLPLLNRGLALVAAGDYVTATTALEDGLRRFPHIAAFKLDLLAMVGNKDVFDVRRADLENRLAVREQYDLRFLLGYLEFYTGLPEDGLRNLRRAANEAPAGSPIAAFAGLVTGETSLPSLPR
jgi:tetratricopeptide (TPR) repeat protein